MVIRSRASEMAVAAWPRRVYLPLSAGLQQPSERRCIRPASGNRRAFFVCRKTDILILPLFAALAGFQARLSHQRENAFAEVLLLGEAGLPGV